MSEMDNKSEREQVVGMIRACLLSVKLGVPLSSLDEDYETMVGGHIPYRSLGYESLEQFVRSVPELLVTSRDGKIMLSAAPSASSQHLSKLVALQKSSKKKIHHNSHQTDKLRNRRYREPKYSSLLSRSWDDGNTRNESDSTDDETTWINGHTNRDVRERHDASLKDGHTGAGSPTSSNTVAVTKVNNSHDRSNVTSTDNLKHSNIFFPTSTTKKRSKPKLPVQVSESKSAMTGLLTPIQLRLAALQNQLREKEDKKMSNLISVTTLLSTDHSVLETCLLEYYELEPELAKLKVWTENNNFPVPEIFVVHEFDDGVLQNVDCIVSVGIFSFIKRMELDQNGMACLEVAASVAYMNIRCMALPIELKYETPKLIINQVLKIIYQKEEGILQKLVPKAFKLLFKASNLPENWMEILFEKSGRIAVIIEENIDKENSILKPRLKWKKKEPGDVNTSLKNPAIFPRLSAVTTEKKFHPRTRTEQPQMAWLPPSTSGTREQSRSTESSRVIQIGEITAFPDNNTMDVLVTHVVSTTEVWVRILGPSHSVLYSTLCADMDIHYMDIYYMDKSMPNEPIIPVIGSYYAIYIESCWHRVKLLSVEQGMATLFFVDQGGEDQQPATSLLALHYSFAELPAQAVHCILSGLEDLTDTIHISILVDTIIGIECVAYILDQIPCKNSQDKSGTELFGSKYKSAVASSAITCTVILFDTSTLDVNINHLLATKISRETLPPMILGEGQAQDGYISYVEPNGHVFIRPRCDSNKLLPILMSQMMERPLPNSNGVTNVVVKSHVYLAYSENDYHRVVALSLPNSDGKVIVHFMDCGHSERVHITTLIDIEPLSIALFNLPPQAIRVLLFNPSAAQFTDKMTKRLMELVPKDLLVLVKVVRVMDVAIPEVEIFKRIQPDDMLVSVNNTLFLDSTLVPMRECQMVSPVRSTGSRPHSRPQSRSQADEEDLSELLAEINTMGVEQANSMTAVPTPPVEAVSLSPPVIPQIGSHFDVYVPMVSNPNNFFVQPYLDRTSLELMMHDMQVYYRINEVLAKTTEVLCGSSYAALHSDGNWYRVTTVNPPFNNNVMVSFVDFGDLQALSLENIRLLAPQFQSLPCQAIRANLHGIKPSHGDWSVLDCIDFQELVNQKEFVSVVMSKSFAADNPNTLIISLKLIDTSSALDIYIDELLVEKQIANYITDK